MGIKSTVAHWFGFEQKANPAFMQYTGLMYGNLPQPVMMQANPKAFMKEGYRRNDTVYKCVSYIARNAAGVRLALYTDATKKREIENHPLLDLLSKPNKDMSGNDFVESVCAYTLLLGNSYQYSLRLAKQGPPDELWALRPDLIDIVPSKRGVVRYDYKINDPPTQFEPDLIGHTKFWSPDDDLYGLSPIEVAAIFIDMNLAYNKWNLALTQNYSQPPGAWTTPALLGKKERDTLEHNIHQKYQGFKNAGKAPVLDGGLKWESTAVPPAQMAWLEGRSANSVSGANIYFLAPQLVGDTGASTYDNMEQAVYGSYTEAIFPLLDKVTGTWNRWLVPMYGKNLYLSYDKQSVETIQKIMQAQESAKAERWTKIWLAGGCKLDEYRDKIGLEPAKVGGASFRIKDILIAEADLEKYAEQCLTAPALPPLPIAEGQMPPPGTTVEGSITKPPALPAPKKGYDRSGTYQPDDLEEQLNVLRMQGTQYVQWKAFVRGQSCEICIKNEDITVVLGDEFPSGHILPPAHPGCNCKVVPAEQKNILPIDLQQKRTAREEYQQFSRRYV